MINRLRMYQKIHVKIYLTQVYLTQVYLIRIHLTRVHLKQIFWIRPMRIIKSIFIYPKFRMIF